MSEEEGRQLKVENLTFKLNAIAQQRMTLLDTIWELELESEKLRLELMCLITGICQAKGI